MESVKKPRRVRSYEALTDEIDIIGADNAIFQAAYVLDLAGRAALKEGDIAAMIALSEMWLEVAKSLMVVNDSETEEEPEKTLYGFGYSSGAYEKVDVDQGEINHERETD